MRAIICASWCVTLVAATASADDSIPAMGAAKTACDDNVASLALALGRDVLPDPALCARLSRDLTNIRKIEPRVTHVRHYAMNDGRTLSLMVDDATLEQMRSGKYTAWNEIHRRWGEPTLDFRLADITKTITLKLPRFLRLDAVGPEYKRLPGVILVEMPQRRGCGTTINVTMRGAVFHYVLDDASGELAGCTDHHQYYFTADEAGRVTRVADWRGPNPVSLPPWLKTAYGTARATSSAVPAMRSGPLERTTKERGASTQP